MYLDKNHPENGLERAVPEVMSFVPDEVVAKILYLIPKIENPMNEYPFSFNFLMHCYFRLLGRENHETLDNSDPLNTTRILFMFFKLFHKVIFN